MAETTRKKKRYQTPTTEPGDNTRYLRHALAMYHLPAIDISDIKQVEARIDWYFNHCAEDDMKPGVVGLANALGISRDTLLTWANGEYRGATHSAPIKRALQTVHESMEDYMQNGKINPVAGIFLMKNNYNYADKTEVTVKGDQADGIPADQLQKKYEDALPDETEGAEGAESAESAETQKAQKE